MRFQITDGVAADCEPNMRPLWAALEQLRIMNQHQWSYVKVFSYPEMADCLLVAVIELGNGPNAAIWPALEEEISHLVSAADGTGVNGVRRCTVKHLLRQNGFPDTTMRDVTVLSTTTYEGASLCGTLVSRPPDNARDRVVLRFRHPTQLSHVKGARKLLEMTSERTALTTELDGRLHALVRIPEAPEVAVRFQPRGKWGLEVRGILRYIISTEGVSPPKRALEHDEFVERLRGVFDGGNLAAEAIWDVIRAARIQRHGTMVVINDAAANEARRLAAQSTLLREPRNVHLLVLLAASTRVNIPLP